MLIASVPTKIDIIWAQGASGSAVRVIPDTSSDPNAASWTLGWPPNTAVDPGAGGEPPDYRDFNGALKMLSAWTNWLNAGAPVFYDAAFSSSIGGYPKYAQLANATTVGQFWISQVDNNTSDPDTGGANWMAFPPTIGGYVSSFNGRTGAVVLSSVDVVNALAANALPLAKIAQASALSVLGNPAGSPATAQWLGIAALLGLLGLTANLATNGHLIIPVVNTGGGLQNLIINWGTTPPISQNSGNYTAPFDVSCPNAALTAVCTKIGVGNSTWPSINALAAGSVQIGMNAVFGSGDGAAYEVFWIALGW